MTEKEAVGRRQGSSKNKTPAMREAEARIKYNDGRKCTICKWRKVLDEFYLGRDGNFSPTCKPCNKEQSQYEVIVRRFRKEGITTLEDKIKQLKIVEARYQRALEQLRSEE